MLLVSVTGWLVQTRFVTNRRHIAALLSAILNKHVLLYGCQRPYCEKMPFKDL